jgi:hypothetical protein
VVVCRWIQRLHLGDTRLSAALNQQRAPPRVNTCYQKMNANDRPRRNCISDNQADYSNVPKLYALILTAASGATALHCWCRRCRLFAQRRRAPQSLRP